jgi:hypothetical protein
MHAPGAGTRDSKPHHGRIWPVIGRGQHPHLLQYSAKHTGELPHRCSGTSGTPWNGQPQKPDAFRSHQPKSTPPSIARPQPARTHVRRAPHTAAHHSQHDRHHDASRSTLLLRRYSRVDYQLAGTLRLDDLGFIYRLQNRQVWKN